MEHVVLITDSLFLEYTLEPLLVVSLFFECYQSLQPHFILFSSIYSLYMSLFHLFSLLLLIRMVDCYKQLTYTVCLQGLILEILENVSSDT